MAEDKIKNLLSEIDSVISSIVNKEHDAYIKDTSIPLYKVRRKAEKIETILTVALNNLRKIK